MDLDAALAGEGAPGYTAIASSIQSVQKMARWIVIVDAYLLLWRSNVRKKLINPARLSLINIFLISVT